MKSIIFLCLALCLIKGVVSVDPPTYNFSYHVTFDEVFTVNGTDYEVNGQVFYDPVHNRERVDRVNGRYDLFCGQVLPNVSTPCLQYTVDNRRWIVFPQKSQCCFCCDSAHGCGILKPDWLADASFMGEEKIIDTVYEKWSKDGMFGYNWFWSSKDANRTPRRLD